MSVVFEDGTIRLAGECRVEDAEPLFALLQESASRTVDLTAASRFHTAVVQVLLAFQPSLLGPSGDAFVQAWMVPPPADDRG